MAPPRWFKPRSGEGSCPRGLGLGECRLVASGARWIAAQILGLGDRKTGSDHPLAEICAIDRDDRYRPTIAGRWREPDRRGFRTERIGREILGSLAALPAAGDFLAELATFEGIDAEEPKIDRDGVTIQSPRLRVESLRPRW